MFRKALSVIFLLIVGGGGWMLIKGVTAQSQTHIKTTALWTVDTDESGFFQFAFEDDGKTLVSVHSEIKKWDVATGKLKSTTKKQDISWQRISADGKYYAYAIPERLDGKFDVWKVNLHDAQSDALLHTFKIPDRDANLDYHAIFTNKSKLLSLNYTLYQTHPKRSYDTFTNVFTVWDTQSGKRIHSYVRSVNEDADPFFGNTRRHFYQNPIFSPDNKQLWLLESTPPAIDKTANADAPLKVHLTDLMGNRKAAVFSMPPQKNRYSLPMMFSNKWIFLCASPKEPFIAAVRNDGISSSEDGMLCGFNVKTQQILWHREAGNFSTHALAFSPDGKFLAWGGSERGRNSILGSFHGFGKVFLLDPKTGETIAEVTERTLSDFAKRKQVEFLAPLKRALGLKQSLTPLPGETLNVESLAFSPDSKKLAVGYRDGTIKLWKIQ